MIRELIAHKFPAYGTPFSKRLNDDLANPYRRALLLAGFEIKKPEEMIFKLLAEDYPEMFQNLTDILGTTMARLKGKKITSIFQKKSKPKISKEQEIIKLPDGTIVRVTK